VRAGLRRLCHNFFKKNADKRDQSYISGYPCEGRGLEEGRYSWRRACQFPRWPRDIAALYKRLLHNVDIEGYTKMRPQRLIDANLNRLREGLRVCEDIARFAANDKQICSQFKNLRHRLQGAMERCGITPKDLISARETKGDVGRSSAGSERTRKSLFDIFYCNLQRCKESLRVIEEISKLINGFSSEEFKALRYKLYSIEKLANAKLEPLRSYR